MNRSKDAAPHGESKDIPTSFLENSAVEWVIANIKYIGLAIVALFLLLLLFRWGFGWNSSAKENDYIQADRVFRNFELSSENDVYTKLAALLVKFPELQEKYDGEIGQILLNRGNLAEAKPYILRTLKRTEKDQLTWDANFSDTTLLIAEKNYSEALKRSLDLKKMMLSGTSEKNKTGGALYCMNLLRIALLFQWTQAKSEEVVAWRDLKNVLEGNVQTLPFDSSEVNAFSLSFQEGKTSLLDYIKNRGA